MHSIKVFALVLLALLVPVLSVAQPVVLLTWNVTWDYTDAQIASGAVDRFEMQFDGGGWADAAETREPGTDVHRAPLPLLALGQHTVEVRACNAQICSAEPLLDFLLTVFVDEVGNLRIEPTELPGVPSAPLDGSIRVIPTP